MLVRTLCALARAAVPQAGEGRNLPPPVPAVGAGGWISLIHALFLIPLGRRLVVDHFAADWPYFFFAAVYFMVAGWYLLLAGTGTLLAVLYRTRDAAAGPDWLLTASLLEALSGLALLLRSRDYPGPALDTVLLASSLLALLSGLAQLRHVQAVWAQQDRRAWHDLVLGLFRLLLGLLAVLLVSGLDTLSAGVLGPEASIRVWLERLWSKATSTVHLLLGVWCLLGGTGLVAVWALSLPALLQRLRRTQSLGTGQDPPSRQLPPLPQGAREVGRLGLGHALALLLLGLPVVIAQRVAPYPYIWFRGLYLDGVGLYLLLSGLGALMMVALGTRRRVVSGWLWVIGGLEILGGPALWLRSRPYSGPDMDLMVMAGSLLVLLSGMAHLRHVPAAWTGQVRLAWRDAVLGLFRLLLGVLVVLLLAGLRPWVAERAVPVFSTLFALGFDHVWFGVVDILFLLLGLWGILGGIMLLRGHVRQARPAQTRRA